MADWLMSGGLCHARARTRHNSPMACLPARAPARSLATLPSCFLSALPSPAALRASAAHHGRHKEVMGCGSQWQQTASKAGAPGSRPRAAVTAAASAALQQRGPHQQAHRVMPRSAACALARSRAGSLMSGRHAEGWRAARCHNSPMACLPARLPASCPASCLSTMTLCSSVAVSLSQASQASAVWQGQHSCVGSCAGRHGHVQGHVHTG